MKKYIIWQNLDLNIKDYEDFLKEAYPEVTDDNKKYEIICDLNNDYIDDERMNLDIQLSNSIVAISSRNNRYFGGTKYGYKVIKSGNIKDILYDGNADYCKWYCTRYNVKATLHDHDGTTEVEYRMIKDEEKLQQFLDIIYNNDGPLSRTIINYYTDSIVSHAKKVYGW
jgi:hypothetical protein